MIPYNTLAQRYYFLLGLQYEIIFKHYDTALVYYTKSITFNDELVLKLQKQALKRIDLILDARGVVSPCLQIHHSKFYITRRSLVFVLDFAQESTLALTRVLESVSKEFH